jgi:hypothetical protein
MMESRVMPSSTFSVTGGVISLPLRTMKMLQVAPSATWPLLVEEDGLVESAAAHSSLASALFT